MKVLAKSGGLAADLASAFDASPNPYVLLSPDLVIMGANQAYLDVVDRERDDIVGRTMFEAFDGGPGVEAEENRRQLRASFERVLTLGERDHLALIRYALPGQDAEGRETWEDRYWSATHTPIRGEDGRIVFILQHTSDITELHTLRQRMSESALARTGPTALDAVVGGEILHRAQSVQADNRRLEGERNRLVEMFMQAPGFMTVLDGPDHVFQMHNAAYAQLIGHREIDGKPLREALPEVVEQGFVTFLDDVFRTGQPHEGRATRVQLQRTPDGPLEDVYLNFIYQPIRDGTGRVAGIFVQGHDVTQTVLAAERQKLMIDELNHRVKNTLATVQSIAMQTARFHADPRTFAEGFQARLLALSHTHDLLTRSHWEGASLVEVLEHETEAHGAHRVSMNGPRVHLSPAAALSLGMIFHELATNAAKYGALSTGEGRVLIDWHHTAAPRSRLALTWRETGGPAVSRPEHRGFGSRLIERNARHDLAGGIELHYASDGLVAEIEFPLEKERSE